MNNLLPVTCKLGEYGVIPIRYKSDSNAWLNSKKMITSKTNELIFLKEILSNKLILLPTFNYSCNCG